MIVNEQEISYEDWVKTQPEEFHLGSKESLLDLPEGTPVVGYKAFYRAAADKRLYPMESEGIWSTKPYEEGRVPHLRYSEDAPITNVNDPRGFFFWANRENADTYVDKSMLHARGYIWY